MANAHTAEDHQTTGSFRVVSRSDEQVAPPTLLATLEPAPTAASN
jgi:hypothetical protein